MNNQLITLVGCGNMGSALLHGWLNSGIKADYLVIKPHDLPDAFKSNKSVTHAKTPDERMKNSSIVVLAVKPQIMNDVCADLKPFVAANALIISTAAGRDLAGFEKIFGPKQPIVRTIPNLPAAIGKGMTMAVANENATKAHKTLTNELFECVGALEWLDDENLMNAASVVSGAGPAFIFYLTEVLTKAAENNGVPADLAREAARQTVIGAAALMEDRDGISPEDLRRGVTSPKGITEAALKILMNGEMQKLFDDAVAAAAKRGAELNS